MTGQVLRILVEVGDAVEEGDVVVVMESMKLELQLQAQHAGTIVSINCAVGSIVDRGVAVAEIDHGSHLLTVCQWQGLERLSGLPQPRQLAPLRRSTRLDGNKRLGWLATAVFLELNGQTPSKVSNEAVYELVCAVAAGDFTVDEIASLIRAAAEDV